jgi:hypothetical protein
MKRVACTNVAFIQLLVRDRVATGELQVGCRTSN